MMTVTQSVLTAIDSCLKAAGLDVRGDTDGVYSFETVPCIVLDCGDEYPDAGNSGVTYWNLAVMLLCADEGAAPKTAPEPTRRAAHVALYADRTLGGLVMNIQAGAVSRGIDSENPARGITQAVYNIKYRTMEDII